MTNYGASVAHPIHSITVEDIRYFFDPDFPVENTIPTGNDDIKENAELVLRYAPSSKSSFKFPAFAAFDYILSNNDEPMKFGINGLTTLEKLGHQLHMQEIWMKASLMYKVIKTKQIDTASVCPCLVDEENNGILKGVNDIAHDFKLWMPQPIVDGFRKVNMKERAARNSVYRKSKL